MLEMIADEVLKQNEMIPKGGLTHLKIMPESEI